MTGKRLSKEIWEKIEERLKDPNKNISQIAKEFGISRLSVYSFAWHRGWLIKKPKIKKEGFFSKIINKFRHTNAL